MKWPWNLLRSLGLYNARQQQRQRPAKVGGHGQVSLAGGEGIWGVDLLTNLCMQFANDPGYYLPEQLSEFIENGKLAFIPTFLHPPYPTTRNKEELDDEDAWLNYMRAVHLRVYAIHVRVAVVFGFMYFLLTVLRFSNDTIIHGASVGGERKNETVPKGAWSSVRGVKMALFRLGCHGMVSYGLWMVAKHHVDSTQWAMDIRKYRLYRNVLDDDGGLSFGDVRQDGWTTLPTSHDVLLEHRIGKSHYMAMFRDFIPYGHWGNAQFHELVQTMASKPAQSICRNVTMWWSSSSSIPFHYSTNVKKAIVRYIFDTVTLENQGRFLEQGISGCWYLMYRDEAYQVIAQALAGAQYPVLGALVRDVLDPQMTELRYGIYKDTALAQRHAAPFLRSLKDKVYAKALVDVVPSDWPVALATLSMTRTRPVASKTLTSADGATLLRSWPHGTVANCMTTQFKKLNDLEVFMLGSVQRRNFNPKKARRDVLAVENGTVTIRKSIFGSASTVKEPYYGAWLRTESLVEVSADIDNFIIDDDVDGLAADDDFIYDSEVIWNVGVVVNITADGRYLVWHDQEEMLEYSRVAVRPFDPNNWVLATTPIQVNLDMLREDSSDDYYYDDVEELYNHHREDYDEDLDYDEDFDYNDEEDYYSNDDDWPFKDCVVLSIRKGNNTTSNADNNNNMNKNFMVADVQLLSNGRIHQNIDIMALRLVQSETQEPTKRKD